MKVFRCHSISKEIIKSSTWMAAALNSFPSNKTPVRIIFLRILHQVRSVSIIFRRSIPFREFVTGVVMDLLIFNPLTIIYPSDPFRIILKRERRTADIIAIIKSSSQIKQPLGLLNSISSRVSRRKAMIFEVHLIHL